MRSRTIGGTYNAIGSELRDFLPNVHYVEPDKLSFPGSDVLVIGTVAEVVKGVGVDESVESADGGETADREVAFDAPNADWRTLHVMITPEESWGAAPPGSTYAVGMVDISGMSFDDIEKVLLGYGRVAVLLYDDSPLFDYDSAVRAGQGNGLFFAVVGSDGSLRLPFVDPGDAARYLKGTATVDQLRAEAQQPTSVVPMTGCPSACKPAA